MAILDSVPGLQITIQSSSADLPEHPDTSPWSYRKYSHIPQGMRSSCYIEIVPESEFRIRLLLKYPYRMTSENVTFKASVDGHGIAQASCNEEVYQQSYGVYMELITARLERISPSELSSRSLKFSSLKKVDDADPLRVKNDAKLVAGMGSIIVSVFRTYQRDVLLPPVAGFDTNTHIPPTEVAEKALKGKAISCGVGYGEKRLIQRTAKEYVDIDGSNNPIGVFVFKYRSRADLQAEMIIPRSESPDPYQQDDEPASPRAEIHDLERRISELRRVKREMVDLSGIKRERGIERAEASAQRSLGDRRPMKMSRTNEGRVCIDLTDDD